MEECVVRLTDKKSGDILTPGSLEDLRGAINALFDVFVAITEHTQEYNSNFNHSDVLKQLQDVEVEMWAEIRNRYLRGPLQEFCNDNCQHSGRDDYTKILLDFIQLMDAFQQSVTERLQEYETGIARMKDEKQTLQRQYFESEAKYRDEKSLHSIESMELKRVKCSILYYESVVQEKSKKIAELQRMNTVHLWEREKKKILEDATVRIEDLNMELAESKKSNETALKKIHTLEEHLKLIKLKKQRDLSGKECDGGDCKNLKRANYLLEKDVNFLEGELYTQQKSTVAAVLGIKTDIAIMHDTCRDPETNEDMDKNLTNLLRRVEFVYHAIKDGELQKKKSELLPHYLHVPKDVKLTKFKRLSGKPLYPLKPTDQSEDDDDAHLLEYTLPSRESNNINNHVNHSAINVNHSAINVNHSAIKLSAIKRWSTVERKLDCLKPTIENPVMVNDNGTLMGIQCLKYFPSMSKEFVQDHLNQFRGYDRNGDGTLDFQEVIKAINGMGVVFSAAQAEEAMREMDINGSRTLDFYEYLQFADILYSKKGHAHLLRTGIAQTHNKIVAKTCVVQ